LARIPVDPYTTADVADSQVRLKVGVEALKYLLANVGKTLG
jgi:cystathionine beta-lyase/cystathionine gamma-synthase